ncbi:uncharacterized protein LOC123561339 [Mercenaria mercenaria]|uniref:uncharacterized protein LOC123561339 n=1 Tax=Mercenaria mercenaria TaxID=6596 RepID=UPI00234F3D95|nr:uncharacterized protein LOC123561339 [Mercenaria mercenaria]
MFIKSIVLCCGFLAVTSALNNVFVAKTGYKAQADNDNVQDVAKKLEHLETSKKFEDLLARMEHLEAREKSREKTYLREIKNLKRELLIQTRRTASFEIMVRRLSSKSPGNLNHEMDKTEETSNDRNGRIKSAKTPFREVMPASRIRRAENENPVAFFATLSQHLTHMGAHQPITFDNVVTNIGNAYNSHFGSFIAPVSGTYVFSATLFALLHNTYSAEIVKNGQTLTRMYVYGSDTVRDTTSQTIVLELQKGDDVSVHNINVDRPVHGDHYSTFAGFLLQEDFSSSAIVGK